MWQWVLLIIIIIFVHNKRNEKRKLMEARGELINDVLNEITLNAKNWYCIGVGLDRVYYDYPGSTHKYPSQKFGWGRDSNTVVAYDRRGYTIHVYDFDEHNYAVSIEAKEAIADAIAQRFGGKVIHYMTVDHDDSYSPAGVLVAGSDGANGFKVFSNQLLLDENAIVDRENAKRWV